MTIRYSTSGAWGSGVGTLTPAQFDENFWTMLEEVQGFALGTLTGSAVGIESIQLLSGAHDQFTVTKTNGTVDGPFELTYEVWHAKGPWVTNTSYAVNDVVSHDGSIYLVIFAHISQATFDAGANDGLAHDYYKFVGDFPDATLPTGGLYGDTLVKTSNADFDDQWGPFNLLGSVPQGGSGPVSGFDFPADILSKDSAVDFDTTWLPPTRAGTPVSFQSGSGPIFIAIGQNQYYHYGGTTPLTLQIQADLISSPPLPGHTFAPIGSEWTWRQSTSTGTIAVEALSGVTLHGVAGHHNQTAVQGAVITIKKVGTDEYDLFGLLA